LSENFEGSFVKFGGELRLDKKEHLSLPKLHLLSYCIDPTRKEINKVK